MSPFLSTRGVCHQCDVNVIRDGCGVDAMDVMQRCDGCDVDFV